MLRTRIHRTCIVSAMLLAVPCLAIAQEAAAPAAPAAGSRAIPRPDELEPGVNTTPAAPAVPAATAPTAAPAAAPAAGASAAKPASTRQNAATAKATTRKTPDRLDLDATDIKGNRELPKVLYIVPWKRADLGDVVGKPVNSLLDEVLQPLDRDVFKRENRYYDDLKPGAGGAKVGAAQGSETKP
ncbi:MAG TPA: hypothetical protein VE266_07655 [Steroidobacteraceae bacterium]|nr:hypothetical protein [Steroidobacteraceae bacterium]